MDILKTLQTCNTFVKYTLNIDAHSFQIDNDAHLESILHQQFLPNQIYKSIEILRKFLTELVEKSITIISDRLQLNWMFINTQGWITLIGPYHTRMTSSNHVQQLLRNNRLSDQYSNAITQYMNTINSVDAKLIKNASNAYIQSIYNDTSDVSTTDINLDAELVESQDQPAEQEKKSYKFIEYTHDLEIQYMSAISVGNTPEALLLLRQLMLRTNNQKMIGNREKEMRSAVAGAAIVRTSSRIAGKQAGVPSPAIDKLTRDYARLIVNAESQEEILNLMLDMVEQCCDLVRQHRLRPFSPTVRKAIHFILLNIGMSLNVKQVARVLNISPNHLSTIFHKETGERMMAYIRRLQLERSEKLLVYSNMSIQEICASVGIIDNNYFTKLFKMKYGMTPSQYRKEPANQYKL